MTHGKQIHSPFSPSTQSHWSVGEGDGVAGGAVSPADGVGSAVASGLGLGLGSTVPWEPSGVGSLVGSIIGRLRTGPGSAGS